MEKFTDKKLLTPAMNTALKKVTDAAAALNRYTFEKMETAIAEHNELVEKYEQLEEKYSEKLASEKKNYQIKLEDVKRNYNNQYADLKLEHERKVLEQNTTTLNKLASSMDYALINEDELETLKDEDELETLKDEDELETLKDEMYWWLFSN